MSTESIANFIKISDRVGTGGQPTKEQLQAARSEGYEAVINLAPEDADNHALPGEALLVESLGMAYHHIPVEWSNPEAAQFRVFTETMLNLKDHKVLVHCAANFRVSAFYALYAVKHEGWTLAKADDLISRIWDSRPDYGMDNTWRSFIDDMRASLAFEGTP